MPTAETGRDLEAQVLMERCKVETLQKQKFLGGLFGPLKGLIGELSPFTKGVRGICPRNCVRKINRKL